MTSGIISHIQRFSIHDGPGARTTVFLMGCPLRCFWCHNPETLTYRPEPIHNPDKCLRCLNCVVACPTGALRKDSTLCVSCFKCADACPPKALSSSGRITGAIELMEEVLRDKQMYGRTGGGVTFSGGEPTVQHEFLDEMLGLCAAESVHTAIDTSGLCNSGVFLRLCRKASFVLLDLKHMDSKQHSKMTGKPNELILENAKLLAENGIRMEIRIPIIPGYNDDEENLIETARFAGSLSTVESMTLLGYHKLGLSKYFGLGRRQSDPGIEVPDRARMERICEIMQDKLPSVPVSYY